MRFFESEVSVPEFIGAFKQEAMDVQEKILLLLQFMGEEVITFLRSYTGNTVLVDRRSLASHPLQQPGMPRPEPITAVRPTHPGGWADITGDLMRKYKFRIELDGDAWRLLIINSSEHAVYVEARDGLFVVQGVTDPGGPVHKALQHAINKLAPGWKLESYDGILVSGHEFAGSGYSELSVYPTEGS